MVTYLAVHPANGEHLEIADSEFCDCFKLAMRRAVGYVRVKLSAPLSPGAFLVAAAPLGAVNKAEDGQQLLAELQRVLPDTPFALSTRLFDAAAFLRASGCLVTSEAASKVALVA